MIKINNRKIGTDYPPYIIADLSANHNQSLDRALEIVEKSHEAGIDALKLQTYTASCMTLNVKKPNFKISNKTKLWKGEYLYSLYKKAPIPWEWHKPIMQKCKKLGLTCFSTPFSEKGVDFLENLDVPCYKVASFENIHIPLLKKIAKTKKPVIISTGMANVTELGEAIQTLRENGCRDVILLKCTSTYPADESESNLRTIPHMKDLFSCEVGLSDHTLGIGVPLASVALGATVIEKHITLRRKDGGFDSTFSLEPKEMKSLVIESRRAWKALGKISYESTKKEQASLQFKRSIYIAKDMRKGEQFTKKSLKVIRPGFGLAPKYYEHVLGKKISRNVSKGTPLKWEYVN
ncbi:pseudaminic acid synthase [Candidatus Beckwithbacteria bacterium]|nr:pseudaminic acid synthase [Candidatus Beckwithbacteria bacterium]